MPLRHWALYVLALVVMAAALIAFLQFRTLNASDGLRLTARIESRSIHLRWDPNAASRSAINSAFLMLGGERRNLSESEFLKGSLDVPVSTAPSGDLEVRLQVGAQEDSTLVLKNLR